MNNFWKTSLTWAVSVTTAAFTVIPEDAFKVIRIYPSMQDNCVIILNRIALFVAILLVMALVCLLFYAIRTKKCIKGHGFCIQVEYGDIFKCQGKKVIAFDECFTTTVGQNPGDIKPKSVCGQYLSAHPLSNLELQSLIESSRITPMKHKSMFEKKDKYKSGLLVPRDDYLLMSFAKLNKDGLGVMTRDEYLECLSTLWSEIDKHYGQEDVYIPILGSGITRFDDKYLTKQELLELMIESYKLCSHKLKAPNKLHIVCIRDAEFSINNAW